MAVFEAIRLLWEIVAGTALIGAIALSLLALWAIVRWWDDRR